MLERQMLEPGFWDGQEKAQKAVQRLSSLRDRVAVFQRLDKDLEDLEVLAELGEEEEDEAAAAEVKQGLAVVAQKVAEMELTVLLSGPYDRGNAIVALHAGAGGTEAQDWVEMLLRMYTRWAERRGFKVEVLDLLPGDEAGTKSATIEVIGPNAYGYLRSEKGVHRLVRISPFDAAGRRHTSFASVDVLPEVDDEVDVKINPDDLKIDTFRSGGAGGQHVNKTDSAVRITHLPTGIVVTCQNERSQLANRLAAMKMLKARLIDLELRKKEAELAALRGEQQEIAWGSQIRSYVFHPYSLVKDHRTGHETGNVGAVMDGEIDSFIAAYLRENARAQNR
ncbi:protein chain release factor B [Pelotomaculum thermopropionicum SI]|uniref:Peptide chain release factor 2 n=1 Tax=Pelotomaculum thermopropionicum (strain DSM 13744 / JCM 10971 / SI) TaxID=370438 RepID=A5CYJ0_PELTS|nr:protein chain release factor B [Pelotomaculum thermopropionicum SI]